MNNLENVDDQYIIFAPGHDTLDNRVNRTISIMCGFSENVSVFYESGKILTGANDQTFFRKIELETMPRVSWRLIYFVARAVKRASGEKKTNNYYIHDSGFIGLILCALVSLFKRHSDKIIFDYHDCLEWELYHHSSKFIKSPFFRRIFVSFLRLFFATFLSRFVKINLLVGISDGQIRQLNEHFNITSERNLAIPNTRQRLDGEFRRRGDLAILWVGNVSMGRSFERAQSLQKAMSDTQTCKILLIGKYLNRTARTCLHNAQIVECGPFSSDLDIVNLTSTWRTVGVFFGWDDPELTNINSISSVNKIYSYINTVTPFLMPVNQLNMIESLKIPQQFIFENDDDLKMKLLWISQNYEIAQNYVGEIKKITIWENTVRRMLKAELISVSEAKKLQVL